MTTASTLPPCLLPPRVRLGLLELLRYLRTRGLKAGDRLPPQPVLRRDLHLTNYVLSAALGALAAAGLLERRQRAGTVLRTLDLPSGWLGSVAILAPSEETVSHSPFFTALLYNLQLGLDRHGLRHQLFHYREHTATAPDPYRLTRFPGLPEALAEGGVSALLSPMMLLRPDITSMEARGIPVTSLGLEYIAPGEFPGSHVSIDVVPALRTAVESLVATGHRRVALVALAGGLRARLLTGWQSAALCSEELLPGGSLAELHQRLGAGQDLLRQLLLQAPADQPDALIIMDDWIAASFCLGCLSTAAYRPQVVVQTNRQAPLPFALPVQRLEVDVRAFADQALDLCLERLRSPQAPPAAAWCTPSLQTGGPGPVGKGP